MVYNGVNCSLAAGKPMFTKLRLERFKNFRSAELSLGPFTLLVGTNAAGKSNIRDAFRFLHGLGRGYSLPEVFGEKWGESGELLWRGIRGGTHEAAFHGAETFLIETTISERSYSAECKCQFEVAVGSQDTPAHYIRTDLTPPGRPPDFLNEIRNGKKVDPKSFDGIDNLEGRMKNATNIQEVSQVVSDLLSIVVK